MLFFKNKTEKRAEEKNSSDLLVSMLTGNTKITVETAMQVPAVSRCVDMIASAAAELPIKLYRKKLTGQLRKYKATGGLTFSTAIRETRSTLQICENYG